MQTKNFKHLPEICLTVIYLLIIGTYAEFSFDKFKALAPNELGDFLAGAFAPLAFMWLAFGYFQQGKELQQNTRALEIQAEELKSSNEALRLQAEELKNSVEQQKEMLNFSRQQYDQDQFIKRHAARPRFTLKLDGISYISEKIDGLQVDIIRFRIHIENTGEKVTDVYMENLDDIWECDTIDSLGDMPSDSIRYTVFSGKTPNGTQDSLIRINYIDSLGNRDQEVYILRYLHNFQQEFEFHKK